MQIAQSSDKNCSARAISTMRLALGYETGLPKTWGKMGTKTSEEFITSLGDCFPGRTILLVCSSHAVEEASPSDNVEYIGTSWAGILDPDKYIMAFSYCNPDISDSHLVIGYPVIYDSSFVISTVIAVSLQKHEEKKKCQI